METEPLQEIYVIILLKHGLKLKEQILLCTLNIVRCVCLCITEETDTNKGFKNWFMEYKNLTNEFKNHKMDIVALQEIKWPWPYAGKINTKDYMIYYSGSDIGRYYGGVGFAVSR